MAIRLRTQHVEIHAPRELCFEVVASAGRIIEKRSETQHVVEFVTETGGKTVRTVELVELNRPYKIGYRWLEGPLKSVQEEIVFEEIERDRTRLAYDGSFAGRGSRHWLVDRLWIKPLFDREVRRHLENAKQIAEKRAARSRVYPST
ncbi:MAG: hypothetical protein ACRDKT_12680 [Actinomycetota bacterium]